LTCPDRLQYVRSVLYVSYHGDSGASSHSKDRNNVDVIDAHHYVHRDVLGKGADLRELRGLAWGPDGDLWVVNGSKTTSEVLRFEGEMKHGEHAFIGVVASGKKLKALQHPYDLAFVPGTKDWYVSNQNTNVVAGPFPHDGSTPPIASYLSANYAGNNLLHGTFVASAIAGLEGHDTLEVPPPEGLLATFEKGDIKHSVRGITHNGTLLFVADEAADEVKGYDATGKLVWQFPPDSADAVLTEPPVKAPVQVVLDGGNLLIGSSDSDAVVRVDLVTGAHQDVASVPSVSGIAVDAAGILYAAARQDKQILYGQQKSALKPYGPQPLDDEPEFILLAKS
jgi:DNA-binding beta-propeller fold protein YncE